MTRHSKNNTTAGSFTYAERQKLNNYGTQSSKCTKDSLRPLTHCFLCLQVARDPNCCSEGHLACRSCFLEDIYTQKTNFKLKKAEYERELQYFRAKKEFDHEESRERALVNFLCQQRGGSTNLERSQDLMLKTENLLMPSIPKEVISCRSGAKGPHPISLKSLIPIHFSKIEEPDKLGCSICLKPFTSIKACLFPSCGHVVCESCWTEFKTGKKCLVCEKKLIENGASVIELNAEGTGFVAGGGLVESKRYDLAFQ